MTVVGADKLAIIHDSLKETLKWGRWSDALVDLEPWIDWTTTHGERLHGLDRNKHVKVCAMLAEVADHSGLYAKAALAIAFADAWFGKLPQHLETLTDDELVYARECLRARVVSAFVKDYRQGHLEAARDSMQECLALMERLAEKTPRKMWATRGQAYRYLAEVERTTRRYERSRHLLFLALDCYYHRFLHEAEIAAVLEKPKREARLKEENAFLQHRSALCFLAISRVDYLRGVAGAEESARAAQVLLAQGADPLSLATVCLVRGLVQRNQVGKDDPHAQIDAPKKLIESALAVFKDHRHYPKLLWARYERAVLMIVARRGREAERLLKKVEATAQELIAHNTGTGGEWMRRRARRFIAYSYARRSRVARELFGRSDESLKWAERALRIAEERHLPRARVDAMIAKASALLMESTSKKDKNPAAVDKKNAVRAEKVLRDARQRGTRDKALDPRSNAIISALLAQCRLRQDDLNGAENWLKRARRYAQHIEHANVRTLIDTVSREIDDTHGGVVLRVGDLTSYEEAKERLRTFLVNASHRLQLSPAEAAERFRVGQATFYRWLEFVETRQSRGRSGRKPSRTAPD